MAQRILNALGPTNGERVILRYDPDTMPRIEPAVRKALQASGASVRSLRYGPAADLDRWLNRADVYIWLPAGPDAPTPPQQASMLARWLDAGKGRQIHFHWGDGTRASDGLPGLHSSAYDRVYLDGLDIDYAALNKQMEAAMSILRSGEVRVTTAAGTDIRFRLGDRPFCKQNGDASKDRMAAAKVRIDREIELPAGALRVAPLEDSVTGSVVIPWARFGQVEVKGIRLEFEKGVITRASATSHQGALQRYLDSDPGSRRFREFAIGFNPKLVTPPGEQSIPYYGYGAGVIRLSLGDNTELGGRVRGGRVRWFFFRQASVQVGHKVVVDEGQLALRR